jgi:polyisoprenoid-binding protein YceI
MTTTSVATTELGTGTWTIDPVHSSISFSVRHLVVSKVRGSFGTFTGAVTIAGDGSPSVTADIDVSSVSTGNDQRDGHLKSADFFDVEKYPTATFRSTAVKAAGDDDDDDNNDDYLLDGEFTLRGITKAITLRLEFNGVNPGMGHGEVAGFEASVVLNRKDFGINIEMPLEAGGAVVGDQVTITLEIEALKQA